ncbi:MAG: hypothetical protein R3E39_28715 [Anaerolineae bacterium]
MPTRKTWMAVLLAAAFGALLGAAATYALLTTRGLRVQSFTADRQQVLVGDSVTFSWNVQDAAQVAFRFVHLPTGSHGDLWESVRPELLSGSLPPVGQWSYTVPLDLVDTRFKFEIEGMDEAGNKVATRSGIITVSYWPCFAEAAVDCVTPPTQVIAMLQPFEHGYMLWRGDTTTVYVLAAPPDTPHALIGWKAYPDTWAADQSFTLASQPPAGLLQPHGRFTKILADYPELLADIGWATEPEVQFNATLQQTRIVCSTSCSPALYIKLADARIIQLAASQPTLEQGYIWNVLPAS